MVWVVAPLVENEIVVFSVASFETLDRRIGADVEKDIAGAGEIRAQRADRRALGERAQHTLGTDIDTEVGASRDHRLHGLTRAGGTEVLQLDAVLLEDTGLLAEDRHLSAPYLQLPYGDLEPVLGARRRGQHDLDKKQDR